MSTMDTQPKPKRVRTMPSVDSTACQRVLGIINAGGHHTVRSLTEATCLHIRHVRDVLYVLHREGWVERRKMDHDAFIFIKL